MAIIATLSYTVSMKKAPRSVGASLPVLAPTSRVLARSEYTPWKVFR